LTLDFIETPGENGGRRRHPRPSLGDNKKVAM
jgi:hypothetical protein